VALSREPNDKEAQNFLSKTYNNAAYQTYKENGDLKQALGWVNRALELSKEKREYPLETRASILYKLGRVDEAWESIKKAYAIDPEQADIKKTYEVISRAVVVQ
jgi:tetratricopeptide (TPR) repeat protein